MRRIHVGLAFWLGLSGCGGTRTGNPGSEIKSSLVVTGSTSESLAAHAGPFRHLVEMLFPSAFALPPPSLLDSQGVAVDLTDAWLSLKEIRLHAEKSGDGSADDLKLEGPFVVDLLDETPASLGEVSLTTTLKRIRWKLDRVTSLRDDAPAALSGQSLLLQATRGGVDFTLVSDDNGSFSIAGDTSVTPEEGVGLVAVLRRSMRARTISTPASERGSNPKLISARTRGAISTSMGTTKPCATTEFEPPGHLD